MIQNDTKNHVLFENELLLNYLWKTFQYVGF